MLGINLGGSSWLLVTEIVGVLEVKGLSEVGGGRSVVFDLDLRAFEAGS